MGDLEFVQKCIKGDKLAWDEFVDRYSRLIYNYIHSTLKIKGLSFTQGNISDIFQDVFLSLTKENFKKLRTFKGKNNCSLASWLRQVTINLTIDSLRRIKPIVSLDEENDQGSSLKDTLKDTSALPEDRIYYNEKIKQLEECIGALEDKEKYFLELYIYQQIGLQELMGHFGVSRAAMDMRKSRIIEKLKDCFRKKGFVLDS